MQLVVDHIHTRLEYCGDGDDAYDTGMILRYSAFVGESDKNDEDNNTQQHVIRELHFGPQGGFCLGDLFTTLLVLAIPYCFHAALLELEHQQQQN